MKSALPAGLLLYAGLLGAGISCNDPAPARNAAASNLVKEINLKRGNIINCGPPEKEFGSVSFLTSCLPGTKADFELGIALLHSFEYDEAEKAFAKVIDKDPSCAIAYWGVAMSNYHPLWVPPTPDELQKGAKAVAIAQSLQPANQAERKYIDALAVFYQDYTSTDHRTRNRKYSKAMEDLHLADPSNKELAVFYALSLVATADPADKTFANQKKAGALLSSLYPQGADHPGVVHYIIHAYDSPELASLALEAARRYASVAPSSAHAQHMPSHIFTRLGLWDEDIQSNQAAAEAARCYAEAAGIKGHWDEELHALDYLVYSYLQKGDNAAAKKEVDYLEAMKDIAPLTSKVYYSLAAAPSRYALETRDWKAAAALLPRPVTGADWDKHPWEKSILVFARLLGNVNTGNQSAAKAGLQVLKELQQQLLQKKDDYSANQVAIQVLSGTAWIAWKEGKAAEALRAMKEAVEREDKTEKHPVTPGEVLPARQLLGDMYLEMHQPEAALAAYEADSKKHPNRFNSLYGAAWSSEKTGNTHKAKQYYQQLVEIANTPHSTRPEIKKAKEYLQRNTRLAVHPKGP